MIAISSMAASLSDSQKWIQFRLSEIKLDFGFGISEIVMALATQPGRVDGRERRTMQSSNWASEHSEALRGYVVRGMSYSEAVDAINARFGTAYTRSAAIGRARRMGLGSPNEPEETSRRAAAAKAPSLLPPRSSRPGDGAAPPSVFERAEPVKLRCVGIRPRLVSLVDLEAKDCRYPYGGDKEGEAIVFCGHPRFEGSSYCMPHFELTRNSEAASERSAGPAVLRLVSAA
jgi:GcrA cell cycle regulator